MTRVVAFGAGMVIFIAMGRPGNPAAQPLPQAQSQGVAKPPASVSDPCLGRSDSAECLASRLSRIDMKLNEVEASVRELQSRLTRSLPPISMPADPGWKSNPDDAYLQQRIDGLSRTVADLVNRANASGR